MLKSFNFRSAIFVTLFLMSIWQSCTKKVLIPDGPGESHSISIDEAKRFYEQRLKSVAFNANRLSSINSGKTSKNSTHVHETEPIWLSAQLKRLGSGSDAVIAPLHRAGAYIKVSDDKMVKYGFLNYMMMYKDKSDNIVTEWVVLQPSMKWFNSKKNTKI